MENYIMEFGVRHEVKSGWIEEFKAMQIDCGVCRCDFGPFDKDVSVVDGSWVCGDCFKLLKDTPKIA